MPEVIGGKNFIVFDELHKAARWKSQLKGVYDTRRQYTDILVTGSARLDIFRKGGDSLLGRYFLARMHPFSMGEIEKSAVAPEKIKTSLQKKITPNNRLFQRLFTFGGFPEPFLKQDQKFLNVWLRSRSERLIREDLLDLTRTRELSLIETMVSLLPEKVGSPFSLTSLVEDIEVTFPTVRRWLEWISQLFYIYRIPPYSKRLTRSIKKTAKAVSMGVV